MKVTDREKVKEISQEYGITLSNAEVIQLAKEINAEMVLANEEEVRSGAQAAGFKVKGCLGSHIILDAVKEKHVSPQQASKDIDNLIDSGYRIADDIVEAVKDALRRW